MLSIKDNQMSIRNYQKIIQINDHKVVIQLQSCQLQMLGEKFHVVALEKDEMQMEGRLYSLNFQYEK